MFDIRAFSAEVRDHREEALALVGTNDFLKTYRDALRTICDESVWTIKAAAPAPVFTAETLRAELGTAATAAYLDGATRKQIDYIVELAAKRGDFRPMGFNRLTKRQASALIDDLKAGR